MLSRHRRCSRQRTRCVCCGGEHGRRPSVQTRGMCNARANLTPAHRGGDGACACRGRSCRRCAPRGGGVLMVGRPRVGRGGWEIPVPSALCFRGPKIALKNRAPSKTAQVLAPNPQPAVPSPSPVGAGPLLPRDPRQRTNFLSAPALNADSDSVLKGLGRPRSGQGTHAAASPPLPSAGTVPRPPGPARPPLPPERCPPRPPGSTQHTAGVRPASMTGLRVVAVTADAQRLRPPPGRALGTHSRRVCLGDGAFVGRRREGK